MLFPGELYKICAVPIVMKINDPAYERKEKAGQVVPYQVEMAADGIGDYAEPQGTFGSDLKGVFEDFMAGVGTDE